MQSGEVRGEGDEMIEAEGRGSFENGWDGWACGLRHGKQKAGPGRC